MFTLTKHDSQCCNIQLKKKEIDMHNNTVFNIFICFMFGLNAIASNVYVAVAIVTKI